MTPMNLADLTIHPDFTLTGIFGVVALAAILILFILYLNGMTFSAPASRSFRILSKIGAGAGVVLVIGLLGAAITFLGAWHSASDTTEARFHQALQSTYGATTDATFLDAEKEVALPVHTTRGNELVTFRETGGQLVAFRTTGTELPRS